LKRLLLPFAGSLRLAVILVCLLLSSCGKAPPENNAIVLPETPPLSRAFIGYGVINANYTHILGKIGDESSALGFLRKGSIVEVLERRSVAGDSSVEYWVFAASQNYSGWLRESELRVYASSAQALTASKNMGKSSLD
jgi:hypothetical protein